MANYNKSFNFRNGVQVDTDKFIVNTAGLVGIGSTIPTNYLDVNGGVSVTGDIKVIGLVTTSQLYVTGVSTFLGNVGIGTTNTDGAADTNNTTILNAGIVTAVKYYGDGASLSGVRSVSVDGWDIDGTAGVAYTTFNVGIGTAVPYPNASFTSLSVGGSGKTGLLELNQANGTAGAWIDVYGNSGSGDLRITTAGTTKDIQFWLGGSFQEKVTFKSDGKVGIGSSTPTQLLDVSGTTETKILRVSETSLLVGNVTLTNGLTVNGTSTLNSNVTFTGAASTNMTWDKSSNLLKFDDDAMAAFGTNSTDRLTITHEGSGGNANIKNNTGWINFWAGGEDGKGFSVINGDSTKNLIRAKTDGAVDLYWSGGSTDGIKISTSGVGVTVFNQIDAGTLNLDQGYLESINSTGISTVSVGQAVGVGKSTGILRFGSATGTLDLINNDDGDLTFGLDGHTSAGINTGDFKWTHRSNNTLMTLSYGGNLGINEETPIHPLHVGGSSTITGAAWFGNNINVKNNIVCDGNITGSFTLQNPITSNVLSTGISTVGGIHVYGGSTNVLGIGTNIITGSTKLDVEGNVLLRDDVGINTIAVDAYFPLVVNGNMKVNKITGFSPQDDVNTSVTLQYNSSDKLATSNTGVTVTGTVAATSFTGDGSQLTGVTGSGSGIVIKHDGSTVGTAGTINFSTNLDVTAVSAGIVTVTASGSGGGTSGVVVSGSFTASAGSASTINTYAYDSAELMFEYTAFIKNGSDYQTQKLLVMRDGTTVTSTQYAIMYSNELLVQLDATISGSDLLVKATPETGVTGSTTYRLNREAI